MTRPSVVPPLDVGDAVSCVVNHKILYDSLDTKNGPARGVLGLDQFIEWAYDHVVIHVPKVPAKDVGLYHVEDFPEEEEGSEQPNEFWFPTWGG